MEGLTLLSRSGRRLQLGRGGCSNWFREEAPPGGYLAGAWSSFLNASAWDRYLSETLNQGHLQNQDLPWLQQVRQRATVASCGFVVSHIPAWVQYPSLSCGGSSACLST